MTNTTSTPTSSAQWHTISPHTRPLTLTVLELTPLALTLSLSLTPNAPSSLLPLSSHQQHNSTQHLVHNNHHTHAHTQSPLHNKSSKKRSQQQQQHNTTPRGKRIASTGGGGGSGITTGGELSENEDHQQNEEDLPSDHSALISGDNHQHHYSSTSSFKDLLSHGVVVSVNGQPWSRIYAHVSEDEDDSNSNSNSNAEELEWEDEDFPSGTNSSVLVHDESGSTIEEGSITRRRPRKQRFGSSALSSLQNSASSSNTNKDLILSGSNNNNNNNSTSQNQVKRKNGKEKMDKDRAVVVVYGLSPGKEYEVELRVVGLFSQEGGDGLVSTSVLIPPSPTPNSGLHPRSRANSLRSRSRPRSRSNSLTGGSPGHQPNSSPLGGHTRSSDAVATLDSLSSGERGSGGVGNHDTLLVPDTTPTTIIPTPVLNAVDTQTAQLRHLIATAHAEKEHLQNQIKESRRTSQRQESALKIEIENVKKSIEKAGSMDLRSKQKSLATQEQVKQGWNGAELAEKDYNEIEMGLDTLESKLQALKIEIDSIENDFKFLKEKEDDFKEKNKKSKFDQDKKLNEILNKLDKLNNKKIKKSQENKDLEIKLKDIELKIKDQDQQNKNQIVEQNSRKSNAAAAASYYAAGYGQQQQQNSNNNDHHDYLHTHTQTHNPNGQRSLSAHPSLNNLSGHYAAGPNTFRPRGGAGGSNPQGYQPRFPSAGSSNIHHNNRPSPNNIPSQPSPTHPNNFYSIQHPIPPSTTTSPAFRPPKLAGQASRSTSGPTPSSSTSGGGGGGVNVAALPFHPTNFSPNNIEQHPLSIEPSSSSSSAAHHTTTLIPPQLQHRIYLPNIRPRPTPNFHPPPSVLAEQAQNANQSKSNNSSGSGNSPALSNSQSVNSNHNNEISGIRSPNHSPPAFPPLPNGSNINNNKQQQQRKNSDPQGGPSGQVGPSLASIVTRAVLSPTSALVHNNNNQSITTTTSSNLSSSIASSVLKNPNSATPSRRGSANIEASSSVGGPLRKNSISPPNHQHQHHKFSSDQSATSSPWLNDLTSNQNHNQIRRENSPTPPININVSNVWGPPTTSTPKDRESSIGAAVLRKPSRSGSGEATQSNEVL
ncbi:uncharacterized protein L201_001518 [Kwoniella dendrophila CBS 6074]|uniref:Fibronectin type-III domain-containing protein n=1 Tax=Kwoniella dendrophila CBS 6074 TaxID=1295534 RepID=A0AAX4JMJ6_9TREE